MKVKARVNQSSNDTNKTKLLWLSDICLILVAALWGSSYGVAKLSLQYYPILGFLAIRFGLTCLILSPVLWQTFQRDSTQFKHTIKIGAPLGLILFTIFIFETYGLFYTTAANAAFLISLCLIMTPFLEWVILKNRPSNLVFICAVASLLGTYLLIIGAPNGSSDFSLRIGDVLILMAALGRGLMVTLTKKLLNKPANDPKHAEIKPVSSLTLTAVQSLVVFIGSLVLFVVSSVIKGDEIFIPSQAEFWIATIYLVVFCTIFAFFIQNWAVKIGSPSRASLLMGSEPMFGALFAVLLFGEKITTMGWIGGILITVSSVMLMVKQ